MVLLGPILASSSFLPGNVGIYCKFNFIVFHYPVLFQHINLYQQMTSNALNATSNLLYVSSSH